MRNGRQLKAKQVYDGDKVTLYDEGNVIICCDCALTHHYTTFINGRKKPKNMKVEIQIHGMRRSTALRRRGKTGRHAPYV